jgi:hypothetical protein
MPKFTYTGKAEKHSVTVPPSKAGENPTTRFLAHGEVVELSESAAAAFADRFTPVGGAPVIEAPTPAATAVTNASRGGR